MLMKIGLVECDLAFNIDTHGRETTHDYAEKPVVGAMPPLEDVGVGSETLTISGRLIPSKLGGLGTLNILRNAQAAGTPQLVTRGDGSVFGFYVVQSVNDEHTFLDRDGVGQVVDITVKMQKAAAPAASDFFASLFSLLA
ncbi:phage tail protein [Mesorhizobium sp. WSM4935]|uniref:phage tail protein n=1 Tax=Mesorhizobium sp. WSM4935 TaxID=3038547 RepID=UPI0024153789|nr:phage tail protein [Mesorhizobium sp. WSM4935]MDG4877665.1 phage tail protein [Mesorhizobium sp. WSM4935]